MSDISSIVPVTITAETPSVSQAGFGTPLIVSATATFPERVRVYTDASDMLTDGFSATGAEYLCAQTICAQNPRPDSFMVGRLTNKPTMHWTVTPTAVNSFTYQMQIAGTVVSYTADSSATVQEITTGLKTAIDALSLAVTTVGGSSNLTIAANSPGAWFQVAVRGLPGVAVGTENLSLAMDHSDPGIAADLANIALENNGWYDLVLPYASSAMIAAAAGWVESAGKLFVVSSQDSAILTSGTSDIAATLKSASRTKTAVLYHPDNASFLGAALAGRCLPITPGSDNWAFKTLSGPAASVFTATELTNLRGKNCGWYYTVAGVNITMEGKVASGSYIDLSRGTDWTIARIQEAVYGVEVSNDKVPYTDAGISLIKAAVKGVLQTGVDDGLFSDDPLPAVSAPKARAVSSGDRSARTLNGVTFLAYFAGAINKVAIKGTVLV